MVGVDGSEGSFEALMWATHHAHRTGLPLKIVTVTEIPAVYTAAGAPTMPPGSTFDDLVQQGVDINLRAMDDAEAFDLGIAVSGKAVVGTPVVSLIDATPPGDVLVVSATSQHGRMTDVLGSVATGVISPRPRSDRDRARPRCSPGNPATDHRRNRRLRRVQGRPRMGLRPRRRIGASIEVVHGWEYPYRTKDAFFGSPQEIMQRDATALAEEELAELSPERRAVVTATHVLEGKAADVLIDASKDADLVVVGSRGRGGVRSLLMGSVSRTVVQHAMSTVVLVPSAKHWRRDMTDAHRAELPTWQCYDLAAASTVGRLCFLDGDTPIAYPVSFKLHRTGDGSSIVIRTGPGSLMASLAGPASFEIDEIDVESRTAWSVLIRGTVRRSHEPGQLPVPEPWIADGRHVWLLLDIATVSGRRFVARDATDGFAVEWDLDGTDQGPAG